MQDAPQGQARPYVGLRPFDRAEQHLFFGRDRHAQIVVDKILSTRLTVLYAQSGHGKSSILRALVIPELEEEDAIVLYFDEWTQQDPVQALAARLRALSAEAGGGREGADDASLTDLVRQVSGDEERTVVLVLDQFEEYLIAHARHLEPVRKELAALCRARGLDAHVLLSLREEFLAALEPFRQDILDLLQSTYRLEALSEDGLREAIRRPAEACGGSCEEALVERLIADLQARDVTEHTETTVGGSVELPMLQLICSRLWHAAAERNTTDLTIGLYEELGGAEAILRRYVREVMPARRREQRVTARLLNLLAPRSGLKTAFAAEDLAEHAGLPEPVVLAELDRLEKARIVRTRQYQSGRFYELQHDAIIDVVSPWRDGVLARARRARLIAVTLGAAAVIGGLVVAALLYVHGQERQRLRVAEARANNAAMTAQLRLAQAEREEAEAAERWQAGGALEDLAQLDEAERTRMATWRFDTVAAYWVYQHRGRDRWGPLARLLKDHADDLPPDYALAPVPSRTETDADASGLVLEYSTRRELDPDRFQAYWVRLAESLATEWGLLVPRHVRLVPRDTLPSTRLRVQREAAILEFDVDHDETLPVLLLEDPQSEAEAFLFFIEGEEDVRELDVGVPTWWKPSWSVPRWSLPVWKVTNNEVIHGSAFTALLLAAELLENPKPLLTNEAVALFEAELESQGARSTFQEACVARGGRLPQDLAAFVRSGIPLVHLRSLLDTLADHPDEAPDALPGLYGRRVPQAGFVLPERFHGPWGQPRAERALDALDYDADAAERLRDAAVRMPASASRIRVYPAGRFQTELFARDGLDARAVEGVDIALDDTYRRYGVIAPEPQYFSSGWAATPTGDACRILVLSQDAGAAHGGDEYVRPFSSPVGGAVDRFRAEYARRCADFRTYWISPDETAAQLHALDEASRTRIRDLYSLTDVKQMLRGVLTPSETTGEPGPEHTIRHGGWLLESLLFWTLVEDARDAPAIVRRLVETQRARLAPSPEGDVPTDVRQLVDRGVGWLLEGEVDAAQDAFREALEGDRAASLRAFPRAWARVFRGWLGRYLEPWIRYVEAAEQPVLGRGPRIDLEDYLDLLDPAVDGEAWRRAVRALLRGSGDAPRTVRVTHHQRYLPRDAQIDAWEDDEVAQIASMALSLYDPVLDPPWLLERATGIYERLFGRADRSQAVAWFDDITRVTGRKQARAWVTDLLRRLSRTALGSGEPDLAVEFAFSQHRAQKPELIEEAVQLLEDATDWLDANARQPEQRPLLENNLALRRAQFLLDLGVLGDAEAGRQAERTFEEVLERCREGLARAPAAERGAYVAQIVEAEIGIGRLLRGIGRYEEALLHLDRAAEHAEAGAFAGIQRMFVHLARAEREEAGALATALLRDLEPEDTHLRFPVVLVLVLTRWGEWEEAALDLLLLDHPYRDYLAMLVHAFSPNDESRNDARQILDRRWADIQRGRDRWPARIRHGDATAWREMLVGYYLGEVSEEEMVGDMRDPERFAASPFAHLPMPRTGLLTEALFYDAIRSRSRGDRTRMRERLQQCVDLQHRTYYEHRFATYLLAAE